MQRVQCLFVCERSSLYLKPAHHSRPSPAHLPQALIAADARLDLAAAVDAAAAVQPIAVPADSRVAVLEFIERRLEQLLVDAGVQVRRRGSDAGSSRGAWGWIGAGCG